MRTPLDTMEFTCSQSPIFPNLGITQCFHLTFFHPAAVQWFNPTVSISTKVNPRIGWAWCAGFGPRKLRIGVSP
jgi:hypothetical protein